MDNKRLLELAGVTENVQTNLDNQDIARLDYLLTYYVEGVGGSQTQQDKVTEQVMDNVQRLQGRNLYQLSPEETEMAQSVLTYGSSV